MTGIIKSMEYSGEAMKGLKQFGSNETLKNILQFNPLTTSVPHHIETSQLISSANDWFYMIENTDR